MEEGATAGFVFQHAGDAEEEPVGVRQFRAGALVGQTRKKVDERLEEGSGERREAGGELHNRKNKFFLTCIMQGENGVVVK